MQDQDLKNAIESWRSAIGKEQVVTDGALLSEHSTATFATNQQCRAVISPANRAELVACLSIAREHKIPLHVISRGKNWGYGSKVAHAQLTVTVDLGRLDKITDYQGSLGYVSLEPGVSFQQLNDFLAAENSQLYLSMPGSTAEASVIGNCMERGIAQGAVPDKMDQIISLEVLLPNGDMITTGMAALPHAPVAHRWGLGPSLEGLFTQSNLGIVTRLTIRLDRIPAFYKQCYFTCKALSSELILALQQSLFKRNIDTGISIFNDYKILASMRQYPFEQTDQTPLTEALKNELTRPFKNARWFFQMAIAAESEAMLSTKQMHLQEILQKHGLLEFDFSGLNEAGPFFNRKPQLSGEAMYWRKRHLPAQKPLPEKHQCGVIWQNVVCPFESQTMLEATALIEKHVTSHGFEPAISIQSMNHQVVYILTAITYDREVTGEDERAMNAYKALVKKLAEKGLYPYRLGIQDEAMPAGFSESHKALLGHIKQQVDPDGILAAGRYDFGDKAADH